ncbi:L,D-transpeptidase family protein [Devosia sp.]|uniref:L,D-transpeptidase family protein n=1 Tax=Devosia sp. TaxID=1871048 RepID=UPI003A8E6D2F
MRIALTAFIIAVSPSVAFAQTELSADAINSADLSRLTGSASVESGTTPVETDAPDPAMIRLQVLLDRAGASPGVIDGYDGENVSKAVRAFETMQGLNADGVLDADVVAALENTGDPVAGTYQITAEDLGEIGEPIPDDYEDMSERDFLGYVTIQEDIAERFHMDIDLLKKLNPDASFAEGEQVVVTAYGPDLSGEVARIEADKGLRQVRAYDANDKLVVAYPATIGSSSNPSPSGTHEVLGVAEMPNYTYNPDENFQQGDNAEKLVIPPGPNGPVGSMWIDLSEPTYGIHGTPEPALIDKTNSHGCVRLTNWDATELAKMVKPGVEVVFVN